MKPSTHNANISTDTSLQKKSNASGLDYLKIIFKGKPDPTRSETIEEYIDDTQPMATDSVSSQERALLSNILKLRDIRVTDVMVPRTDIIAIREDISQNDLMSLLTEKQVSRFPVYRETLDDVLGTIHIKDILSAIARGHHINVEAMLTEIPIVSPSMAVLDLILEMRKNRRHMAMVVDEFGGIDGLVTIGDVIEAIIGEIDDEHNQNTPPQIIEKSDGSFLVDARINLTEFEDRFAVSFTDEELAENQTLGGLLCFIAGHVPARGEIVRRDGGLTFEVLDADPRRVNLIRLPETNMLLQTDNTSL